jgi:signal transduction histidine kinase
MTSIQARYDQGSSLGLLNMRERAELINAELIIKSGPPRKRPGTLIQIRMPYPPAQE